MEPSYASGTSSTPLLGDTIGDNLDRTIERFGDREALVSVHQDLRYTYAQFGEAVDRCARAFIAAGIEPGDRVGIWSPNCAEWALVQYGTAKAGIILVNINPAYRTSELEYVLRQSGCRMLVAATAFKTSDYVQMVAEVRDNLDGLERVVFIGHDWEEFVAAGERVSADELAQRQAATQFDDPINIQYTSGTTGFPKGATLSHHNILNNGYFVGRGCRYSEADRVCIPVPYYHCFGMVMGNLACTSHGACMVIPNGAFDPVKTLQAVPTNMTVITNIRLYNFELVPLSGASGDMAYTVRFRYPNGSAGGASLDDAPSASGEGRYRLGGDKSLRPSEISDDGRHTYVRWPRDRALPAVYAISDTGQEMLVNGMMRDDVFVIDSVAQKLVFRIDKAVATASRVRVDK